MKGEAKGKRANLVVKISSDLAAKITQGEYPVGAKIPSESQLAANYGVSRTVVRESIAALRSSGLVETRQGAGAFVAQSSADSANGFKPIDLQKISSVIEGLELRLAVESEAATLAAERRSPVQAARIMEALDTYRLDVEMGRSPFKSDFQFHVAVAEAANNGRFVEFLYLMEMAITPGDQLDDPMSGVRNDRAYFEGLYAEHRKIAEAVYKRDPAAAGAAMRAHISATIGRYAAILSS